MPAELPSSDVQSANSFEEIFRAATGVSVSVFSYLGHCVSKPGDKTMPAICQESRSSPDGCKACETFHQKLMLAAKEGPVTRQCPKGLTETAIPIRSDHATFGYFLAGQIIFEDACIAHAVRHQEPLFSEALRTTRRLSKERYQAVISLLVREATDRAEIAKESQPRTQIESESESTIPLPLSIAAAVRYIHGNLDSTLSLSKVAKQVSLSPEHFSRKFRESTGITFLQYLNKARVMHANEMLSETSVSISDVAFEAGFSSISQFNRVFKKIQGLSPSQFRQESRAELKL